MDLKRLLESAAESGGVSMAQLVIDACWKYIEKPESSPVSASPLASGDSSGDRGGLTAGPPSLDILRGLVKKIEDKTMDEPVEASELPCRYTEYVQDTGETYACGLTMGHKMPHRIGRRI